MVVLAIFFTEICAGTGNPLAPKTPTGVAAQPMHFLISFVILRCEGIL